MYNIRFDSLAYERSQAKLTAWHKIVKKETLRNIVALMTDESDGGFVKELIALRPGSYNACMRLDFENRASLLIRFPKPGFNSFPEEKFKREVAVLRFIANMTHIPVPFVLRVGTSDEAPAGMGPFIIMNYIDHTRSMSDVLDIPGHTVMDIALLNPNIPQITLRSAYSGMASILLQLSRHSFSQIGSIEELEDGSWSVAHRPFTMNMNQLVTCANMPPETLSSMVFETASSYFETLANDNIAHLSIQRNDAIESEIDSYFKYIARHSFRKIITQKLFPATPVTGRNPFKLFCDDFRPGNVLVDDNDMIVGVIDWEWTYSAPAEFAYSPPWWLLLHPPALWSEGIQGWIKEYEPKLKIFLEELRRLEDEGISDGTLTENERLSVRMQESWDTGDFWVAYAARNSWAFDQIFWSMIITNPRFFNQKKDPCVAALELLSQEERRNMNDFVDRKLKEKEEHSLVDWEEVAER